MQLSEFLSRLKGVKGHDGQFIARCPAHDDHQASLSVSQGKSGKIVLKCQAGCSTGAVVAAMGLRMQDLFNDMEKRQKVAEYIYTDSKGKPLYKKIRYSPKGFAQARANGSGGWEYSLRGIRYVLYHLPEVVEAVKNQTLIYIAEGEKDVETLRERKKIATCNTQGAGHGKWLASYNAHFRSAYVVIIPDNDNIGKQFAQEIATNLKPVAASVKLLDLSAIWPDIPPHGDVTDYIDAATDKDAAWSALEKLVESTDEYQGPKAAMQMCNAMERGPNELEQYRGEKIRAHIIRAALDALNIQVKYNLILNEVEIQGMPQQYSLESAANVLPVFLLDVFRGYGIKATKADIEDYLLLVAEEQRYNPIVDMLTTTRWDGVDRFNAIFEILGIDGSDKYEAYVRKWLVQCVAMAFNRFDMPHGADGVLVLQGEQGVGKTRFFSLISMNPSWFREGVTLDVDSKDSLIRATSTWICELGELDSTLKKEQSALKAHITAPTDMIRVPYARTATKRPRRTSYCGTVNPRDYLRDETGSRRFWTIPVTSIDLDKLAGMSKTWLEQLWAQVYALYQSDPDGFRLSSAERAVLVQDNTEFDKLLPFEQEVRDRLDFSIPVSEWRYFKISDVAEAVSKAARAEQIGRVLSKLSRVYPDIGKTKSHGVFRYLLPPPEVRF